MKILITNVYSLIKKVNIASLSTCREGTVVFQAPEHGLRHYGSITYNSKFSTSCLELCSVLLDQSISHLFIHTAQVPL
jgi:hypothetical protein